MKKAVRLSLATSFRFTSLMLFTLLLFCSCRRNAVVLDYTNAKDQVPQLGNLRFRFSKALVNDSLLNKWDSSEYVQFEPKISGKFRWEHADELVFSPSAPLPPATSFRAIVKNDVLAYSVFNKIENADNIIFRTPDLKLEDIHALWMLQDENSRVAVPQMALYFNYPVDPAELKDKLKITIDGKPADYNMQTLSADKTISIRLLNVKAEDKEYATEIAVDKGLLPKGGVNGTTEPIRMSETVPSPFVLTIRDVESEHDGTTGSITVKTSQQVVAADITSFLSTEPAVKFSAEATEDGFRISSENFDMEKTYSFTARKGLRGVIGGVLKEDHTASIAFGKLEPSIKFGNSKAVYLSGQGAKNIEVKVTNVPKLKVIVSKIYESNLLAAQRYGYYPKNNDQEDEYESYNSGGDLSLGDIVYEQEIDTRSLPKYGGSRLFNFNIADRLPEFKGIYHIMLRSADDYWVNDSRFISLSDIGLIAKEGKENLFVFANSIKTAAVSEGVTVMAYGENNQVLGTGITNAEGVAEIAYTRKEFAGFRPAMVIAKTADDFNYLPFNTTRVNTSRFDVGGKRTNKTGLDAFIYAERDIYRPGERVNFSVIIRNAAWQSPGEIPLKLKFLLPNGKELKTFRKNLNKQGALEGSVDIAAAGITGSYLLEIYTSNDILLSTKSFMIEEFVPDRIKVTTSLDKPALLPGDITHLKINAVNFFGPPASGRNYEAEIQLTQKYFQVKKYDRYNFSLANQSSFFDKIVKEGKTDQNGDASEAYQVPETFKNIGILQAAFYATVFDETGRPVSRNVTADIYTQSIFAGIGDDGYGYYPLNRVIKFPLIAVDKKEVLVNGARLDVKVIKHEYRTVLSKSGSYFRYDSQKEDKLISSSTITINGENTVYPFTPRSPGEYELRVSLPGAGSYVSSSFYSYGSWGGDNSSFEVSNEGNIDIELDKTTYLAGESVKALFKTPFSGKMLVTMENGKLISYQYVNVDKRSATVDLKLTAEHLPNVYITATLIKPHDVSDIPLTVAHGFKNVRVEEQKRKLAVEIIAQKAVRSRTRQNVRIKAESGSMVTLAAVDNGVLQVSGFQTPDPYNYFYASRALEVNAYDLYPLLFPELRASLSSTGGDGELSMDKRINPIQNKRVKILSYWSGIAETDGSGEAGLEFDIPAFSGEVRLMAVAYKNERFGSAEAVMKVADPVVLSTALPRFLSPNDTATVPVTITNTTGQASSGTAVIKVEGPLKIIGNNSQTVTLAANSESRAVFRMVAASTVGAGKVSIQVSTAREKFAEETEISVRPASTLQKITGSGSMAGDSKQRIEIGSGDFLPGSAGYTLVVSRSPVLELGNQLSYLVQYPYGCTEQTISAAFPQLYYEDLSALFYKSASANTSAVGNIQEAIRKIKLRQLYTGALTLWDNEGTEHWWSTVYAAHFLIEAQKAGYEVDKSLLDPMLAYINNRLRNRETINYYYNRDQQKKIAPKEVAYSLYVLALAGRSNISVMNYYKANPALLSLDGRYLLSATYAMAGDKQRFRELLPGSFSGEESVAQTGGSFYSDIRDEAIALNVLFDADPSNAQIPVMARHIVNKLKQRRWYSTQESAFSFLALGKLARAASRATITGVVKAGGKTLGTAGNNALRLTNGPLGGSGIELDTKGSGRLYYWWQSEGISISGNYKEEDNYIKVRRKFYDRFGKQLTGNTFRQNEMIIVQIVVEKSYSGAIDNVVVTDLLPAGFEIENPRTKELPGMDWIKDASTPTQLDVRDDRINLFVDLNSNRQVYYYAVRAVSPGVFHLGPVSADAMYNGEYHSYNGAGTIQVVQ